MSVIIPVFDEVRTVAELVARVEAVAIEKQIIAVDDGSTDGTSEILRDLASRMDSVLVLTHDLNRGKGAAIREALNHATGDVVLIQDADLEYDPSSYHELLAPIEAGLATVVYGSRFLGRTGPMNAWHRFGNRMLTRAFNVLYGTRLTDMETCYKVFPRDAADGFDLRSDRWGIDPEITVRLIEQGHAIHEVPVGYTGRRLADGKKLRWRDGTSVLSTMVRLRFSRRPTRELTATS